MSLFHVSSIRRNEKDILSKFKFVYLHNIWVRVATFTTSHHLQEKSSKWENKSNDQITFKFKIIVFYYCFE